MSCADVTTEGSVWAYCPNTGADVLFCILFALTLITHIVQMIRYKKWYSSVIVVAGVLQTMTYILRGLSIKNPTQHTIYIIWFVLMMVAPIFLNAFVYMVLGRMVYNFTEDATLLGVRAWTLGTIFVSLDVVAFFIQFIGAVVAASSSIRGGDLGDTGLDIYMAGCGFQQLAILGFLTCATHFHQRLRSVDNEETKRRATLLIRIEYITIVLITIRIIFRLVEYSQGFKSSISEDEAYEYVFDSLPMFAGSVLWNVFHPGRLMPGQESDIPSSRERKNAARVGLPTQGRLHEGTYKRVYNATAPQGV